MSFLGRDAHQNRIRNFGFSATSPTWPRLYAGLTLTRSDTVSWLVIALVMFTALRLWVCWDLPLSPDEAYYWIWSRALAPGYLDHPPMVALFVRLGTWIAGDTPLGIRLLGPFAAAFGSIMIWDAGRLLVGQSNAGIAAATLVNAMPLFAIGASVMTPDTPLILFWTGTLWAMVRLAVSDAAIWWPIASLFAGLAMASKYTAGSLVIAVVLWAVIAARQQLRRPAVYAAAIIAGTEFAPIIYWNATHNWVGYAKQGARVVAWQPTGAFQYLGELIGGQLGLATPGIFILCSAGVVVAWRRAKMPGGTKWALLACVSTVPTLVMLQHAIGDRVQANWPAIVYPSSVIAATLLSYGRWRRVRTVAMVTGFLVTGLVYLIALVLPPILPAARDPVARQVAGWDELAAEVDRARQTAGGQFVAVENYALASELARALPPDTVVVGVGPRWASFALPHVRLADHVGVLVTRQPSGVASAAFAVKRIAGVQVIEAYGVREIRGSALGQVTLLPRPSIPIRDHAR